MRSPILFSVIIFFISTCSVFNAWAQFGPKILIDSGMYSSDFTLCDINGDGYEDMVTSDRYLNSGWSYALNNQNNTFDTLVRVDNFTTQPSHIEWGDFDNDGDPDIVVVQGYGPKGDLIVYENQFPNFIPHLMDSMAIYVQTDFEVADFDNDGNMDVLIAMDDSMAQYTNQGNFVFSKFVFGLPQGEVYGMDVKDLDNDGYPDMSFVALKIHIYKNIVGVLTYDTLASAPYSNFSRRANFVELADMDGDNIIDLVYANNNDFVILKHDGNFGFVDYDSAHVNKFITDKFTICDIDNNGLNDIVYLSTDTARYSLQTSLTNYNHNILHPQKINRSHRILCGDVNNDNKPDIYWGNELAFHLNNTPTSLQTIETHNDIRIYPNPAYSYLFMRGLSGSENLKLYSALGLSLPIRKEGARLDLTNLSAGLYFLSIDDLYYYKFVKR